VSWVTESWRLKLLALGLSVLMLGAVAFSQNPPTTKTLTVPIAYTGTVPPNLVLINPPTKTNVTVIAPADVIASVSASSLTAAFDLSKAKVGPRVKVNLIVKSLITGVTVQNPTVPIALDIDQSVSVNLTVVARTPRITAGWQPTNATAGCPNVPCIVTFTGPQSWENHLNAYADFPLPIENTSANVLAQPVVLVQNGQLLDQTITTVPTATLVSIQTSQFPSVTIHVDAKTGTTFRQVVLIDSPPSHGPPTGYRVTSITVDPITVVISGAPAALGNITTITLPAVDLSGHTSDFTFKITIPYPDKVVGSVAIARVTYSISPNPNASPPA
jgi:YbbR domain-containing protein